MSRVDWEWRCDVCGYVGPLKRSDDEDDPQAEDLCANCGAPEITPVEDEE